MLLGKASAAFSESTPNFERNPQIFEEYYESLKNFDAKTAFANLERHKDTGEFFPKISHLKRVERNAGDVASIQETQERLALMDQWEREAVDPPKELMERNRGNK